MVTLEIIVNLWVEQPFSPFLRKRVAFLELLQIIELKYLLPDVSCELLSKRYLRGCSFHVA